MKEIMIDSCFSHVCIRSSQRDIPLKKSHLFLRSFFGFLFIAAPYIPPDSIFGFVCFSISAPFVRSVLLATKLRDVIFISPDILEFSGCNVGSRQEQLSYFFPSIIQSHPDIRHCSP
jgi:hypothetical protein